MVAGQSGPRATDSQEYKTQTHRSTLDASCASHTRNASLKHASKNAKKSCIFTKFFHSFYSQKNTFIIYNLFNFYFSKKFFFFFMKKLIKSEFKCLIFISFLYKIKFIFFHCFYTHKNGIKMEYLTYFINFRPSISDTELYNLCCIIMILKCSI